MIFDFWNDYQPGLPWAASDNCLYWPQLAHGLCFYLLLLFLTCLLPTPALTPTTFLLMLFYLTWLLVADLTCLTLHQFRVLLFFTRPKSQTTLLHMDLPQVTSYLQDYHLSIDPVVVTLCCGVPAWYSCAQYSVHHFLWGSYCIMTCSDTPVYLYHYLVRTTRALVPPVLISSSFSTRCVTPGKKKQTGCCEQHMYYLLLRFLWMSCIEGRVTSSITGYTPWVNKLSLMAHFTHF